ncbi:unnamed protein product [Fusarium graminearum]|uniref:Uncharacterized protein n=1 Tax=Gibberella zeae TaxID=5518 RepID=A0A2H3GTE3_GIBZA|nr:hypothetical protein FGRA07_02541 [Fusarium graminearum]CAG2003244.1 unnamed protein product [Fusarium graminearum]CZS81636.1 unnamed protein product [Fusarium graminearum]VTO83596.1 unnamed protein product [Fusarium graminearum]
MPTSTEFFGYHFTNLGPLTTTYEPPASCTTATTDHLYYANASELSDLYGAVSCGDKMGDCYPSGSAHDEITSRNLKIGGHPTVGFFSPGVICPKGWTTAGVFAQGDEATKDGVFTKDLTADRQLGAEDIWGGVLEPGETLALCCPSGWTGGALGWNCISSVKPFESGTYSSYCQRTAPLSALATAKTVGTSVLSDAIFSLGTFDGNEMTVPFRTGAGGAWPTDLSEVAVIKSFPAVGMVYKEEDMEDANENESDGKDDDNAASTMNGAGFAPIVAVIVSMFVGVGMFFN